MIDKEKLAAELEAFLVSHPDRDALDHPLFKRILAYLRTLQAGDELAKECYDLVSGGDSTSDKEWADWARKNQVALINALKATAQSEAEQVEAIRDQLGPKFKHLAPEVAEELACTDNERELREALQVAVDMIGGPSDFEGLRDTDTVEHTITVPIGAVRMLRAALCTGAKP